MVRSITSGVRTVVCAIIACVACAGPAYASYSTAAFVPCGSTEGYGSFHGELEYSYTGGESATIAITLTNNTEMSLGGFITAMAINSNGSAGGLTFVSSTLSGFTGVAAPIVVPPYGLFEAGAGLGGSFLGGGDPSGGIAVGGSGMFMFTLSGSAAALAALDAETVLSSSTGYSMVVRFRGGAVDDWSDKVVGCALPAPGALALLGAMGLVTKRRRRV